MTTGRLIWDVWKDALVSIGVPPDIAFYITRPLVLILILVVAPTVVLAHSYLKQLEKSKKEEI